MHGSLWKHEMQRDEVSLYLPLSTVYHLFVIYCNIDTIVVFSLRGMKIKGEKKVKK